MMTTSMRSEKLSDLADMCLGKMLDQNKNKGSYYPYLANINVRWGEIDLKNLRKMRFENKELDRYGVKFGDIIICEGGEPGRCAIWKGKTESMMIQKALHRIRVKEGVDNTFLYYALFNKGIQGHYNGYMTGAAIKHLTGESLAKVRVSIPPIETQQKIAAILSAYDDLIENNLQRIKLLEDMAQITYEEWFVRMKFPGHEHTPIDPETGLPEGWRKGKVIDLFELQRGFDLPVQNRVNGDVPILASTGIIDFHAVAKVAGPCVVTGRSGTIGNVSYIQKDFWPLNTTLWVKKFHGCGSAFAYFFLKIFHLERMSGGAAVPSLDRKVVHSQHIIIPSVFLMQKYELDISPSFSLIEDLRNQNLLLKEARDILLPRLMTGMIDVETIELPEALLARMNSDASAV